MLKKIGSIVLSLILSIILSSISKKIISNDFLNTMYTISGIMFSIGMGILCTFNPQSIANVKIYKKIKKHILGIRDSYLFVFLVVSIAFLLRQIISNDGARFTLFELQNKRLIFDLSYFVAIINIISIMYFIVNFIEIQRLNFEISDATKEK